jgi:hypothetical protein
MYMYIETNVQVERDEHITSTTQMGGVKCTYIARVCAHIYMFIQCVWTYAKRESCPLSFYRSAEGRKGRIQES